MQAVSIWRCVWGLGGWGGDCFLSFIGNHFQMQLKFYPPWFKTSLSLLKKSKGDLNWEGRVPFVCMPPIPTISSSSVPLPTTLYTVSNVLVRGSFVFLLPFAQSIKGARRFQTQAQCIGVYNFKKDQIGGRGKGDFFSPQMPLYCYLWDDRGHGGGRDMHIKQIRVFKKVNRWCMVLTIHHWKVQYRQHLLFWLTNSFPSSKLEDHQYTQRFGHNFS